MPVRVPGPAGRLPARRRTRRPAAGSDGLSPLAAAGDSESDGQRRALSRPHGSWGLRAYVPQWPRARASTLDPGRAQPEAGPTGRLPPGRQQCQQGSGPPACSMWVVRVRGWSPRPPPSLFWFADSPPSKSAANVEDENSRRGKARPTPSLKRSLASPSRGSRRAADLGTAARRLILTQEMRPLQERP